MLYQAICRLLRNTKKAKRVPSPKQLMEDVSKGKISILYQTSDDIDDGITIFSNGYIIYGNGNRKTVFSIRQFWIHEGVIDWETGQPSLEYITDPVNDYTGLYGIPTWLYELGRFAERRLEHNDIARISNKEYFEDDFDDIPDPSCLESAVVDRLLVLDLLDELNSRQREVIKMHFFEGYSYEDIARSLNSDYARKKIDKHASRQSVRQMVLRAIDKMRDALSEDDEKYF